MPALFSNLRRVSSPLPSSSSTTPLSPFHIVNEPQTPTRQISPQSFRGIHSPPPPRPRSFDILYTPTCPRKAPRPPQYKHRRRRSRHIRFKDPAHSGLFTLTEVKEEDEEEEEMEEIISLAPSSAPVSRVPSAAPSSACFPFPSPRLEAVIADEFHAGIQDEEMEEIMLDEEIKEDDPAPSTPAKRWTIDVSPTQTVIDQLSSSFVFDDKVETAAQASESTEFTSKAARRPPPLDLSQPPRKRRPTSWYRHHPFAAPRPLFTEAQLSDESQPLPDSSLLSPLPLVSPGVFRARQRSVSTPSPKSGVFEQGTSGSLDNVHILPSISPVTPCDSPDSAGSDIDLECVLQELLASCGGVSPRYTADYSRGWGVDAGPSPKPSTRSSSVVSEAQSSESDLGYDMTSFPLPPVRGLLSPLQLSPELRTPTTPPRLLNPFEITPAAAVATPSILVRSKDTSSDWAPKLQGDHSFLQALTRGEDASSISSSSTLSTNMPLSPSSSFRSSASSSVSGNGGRLPKRMGLPDMWRV